MVHNVLYPSFLFIYTNSFNNGLNIEMVDLQVDVTKERIKFHNAIWSLEYILQFRQINYIKVNSKCVFFGAPLSPGTMKQFILR